MRDYLISVLSPTVAPESTVETEGAAETTRELTEDIQEVQQADPFDGPVEGMFDRLATHLARSFDAPTRSLRQPAGEDVFGRRNVA